MKVQKMEKLIRNLLIETIVLKIEFLIQFNSVFRFVKSIRYFFL
jgi:hypothetical protein